MIVKITRYLILFIVILVSAVYLPRYYWKVMDVKITAPLVLYSQVLKDFVIKRYQYKKVLYTDVKGNQYTLNEYEQLLPFYHYRQLLATGQMPDSLDGIPLKIEDIRRNQLYFRVRPYDMDWPQIPLYPMFESQSGRVRLSMPDVFFRITRRMEFVNASTNSLNEELTQSFTAALEKNHFRFPAKKIYGNPSVRKPFDEGYFILDSANRLFHVKMVKGKPYCAEVPLPPDFKIKYIYVREIVLREFYGLIFTENQGLYLISYDDYKLIKLPVPAEQYDYRKDTFSMMGNLFNRSISIVRPDGITTYAVDRDYRLIKEYRENWKSVAERFSGRLEKALFPFTLKLRVNYSGFVNFYFRPPAIISLLGIAFFFLLTVVLVKIRKKSLGDGWPDLLVVLVTGVYGFIAVLLFDRVDKII